MKKIVLNRLGGSNKQTIGNLLIYEDDKILMNVYSLELPDRENRNSISRIPQGIYNVNKRASNKFGLHFHIRNVSSRKWILIHAGNTYKDIRGCILVGDKILDIDKDNETDVLNSRKTLNKMLDIMPDKFKIYIYDE